MKDFYSYAIVLWKWYGPLLVRGYELLFLEIPWKSCEHSEFEPVWSLYLEIFDTDKKFLFFRLIKETILIPKD